MFLEFFVTLGWLGWCCGKRSPIVRIGWPMSCERGSPFDRWGWTAVGSAVSREICSPFDGLGWMVLGWLVSRASTMVVASALALKMVLRSRSLLSSSFHLRTLILLGSRRISPTSAAVLWYLRWLRRPWLFTTPILAENRFAGEAYHGLSRLKVALEEQLLEKERAKAEKEEKRICLDHCWAAQKVGSFEGECQVHPMRHACTPKAIRKFVWKRIWQARPCKTNSSSHVLLPSPCSESSTVKRGWICDTYIELVKTKWATVRNGRQMLVKFARVQWRSWRTDWLQTTKNCYWSHWRRYDWFPRRYNRGEKDLDWKNLSWIKDSGTILLGKKTRQQSQVFWSKSLRYQICDKLFGPSSLNIDDRLEAALEMLLRVETPNTKTFSNGQGVSDNGTDNGESWTRMAGSIERVCGKTESRVKMYKRRQKPRKIQTKSKTLSKE